MDALLDRAADLIATASCVLVIVGKSLASDDDGFEDRYPGLARDWAGISSVAEAFSSEELRHSPLYLFPFLARHTVWMRQDGEDQRYQRRSDNVSPTGSVAAAASAVANLPSLQQLHSGFYYGGVDCSTMEETRRTGSASGEVFYPDVPAASKVLRNLASEIGSHAAKANTQQGRGAPGAAISTSACGRTYLHRVLGQILQKKRFFIWHNDPCEQWYFRQGVVENCTDLLTNPNETPPVASPAGGFVHQPAEQIIHAARGDVARLQCSNCGHVWPAEPTWRALEAHIDWERGILSKTTRATKAMQAVSTGCALLAAELEEGKRNTQHYKDVHLAKKTTASTKNSFDASPSKNRFTDNLPTWNESKNFADLSPLKYPKPSAMQETRSRAAAVGDDAPKVVYDPDWRCVLPVCPGCQTSGTNVGPNVDVRTRSSTKDGCKKQTKFFRSEEYEEAEENYYRFLHLAQHLTHQRRGTVAILELEAAKYDDDQEKQYTSRARAQTLRAMEICGGASGRANLIRVNVDHWSVPEGHTPLRMNAKDALPRILRFMRGKTVCAGAELSEDQT
ncbi:unnamed protein product [Amoebophrya sp. A120]|nr:unnamed protein product [Amoebophrya sp. A120]|eukprot:GSA120T00006647001.1